MERGIEESADPVFLSVTTHASGGRGKRGVSQFFLLTPGSPPLTLQYPSKADAQKAKSQLLKNKNMHLIQGEQTFAAVVSAFEKLQSKESTR
jgi:hypothetical protein